MSTASPGFADLAATHFDWTGWERLILENGLTIDRPYRSHHPAFPDIIYPLDYGYINDTTSGDGDEVDVFVGSAKNGLVGLLLTTDHRRGDHEMKLLYGCTPEEIYLAHGFMNFDRRLMEGVLVLRLPMRDLWRETGM
jgi:inorganic pyrophosphatase